MFEENIQRIRDVKCIETIMTPYLNSDDNGIRLLSLTVLSNIANETVKCNDGIIKYLVWVVSMAIKTECEVWDIWSLTELAKIVKHVARNDTNRRLLVQHGVVPLLVGIAEHGDAEEKYEAVCSLLNLSVDKQNKLQMIETKEWKIIETLERLAKSSDSEDVVKNVSKDVLCTLHTNQTHPPECLQEITTEESNCKQSSSKADEESSPEGIQLLSWNIEGLSSVSINERTNAVIAIINRENPDVIFLQEVIVDTLEMLSRKCLGYNFFESSVESYFTVIMVKHNVVQVTDSKIVPFTSSTQGRTLQKVEIREIKGLPKSVLDIWIETGRNKETQFTWDTSINTNQTWAANQDFKPKIRFDRIYMRHPKTEPVISPVSFQLISDQWGILVHFDININTTKP